MNDEQEISDFHKKWKTILGVSIVINILLMVFVGLPGLIFWLVPFFAVAKLFPKAGEAVVIGSHDPTEAELKARNKRNVAIALALALFMIFVFVTMVSRGVIPTKV